MHLDGAVKYKRMTPYAAFEIKKKTADDRLRRQRIKELHPDAIHAKYGRAPTEDEKAELAFYLPPKKLTLTQLAAADRAKHK